jgi:hypothetical protein
MKTKSLLSKINKVATLNNCKLPKQTYFNDWDHIIKTDARQLITTKITSSQVNFLESSQIILCSLILYSWNANATYVRSFLPSSQYTSVNPSRKFVWSNFPFHGLLSVLTSIGLQYNFYFWHGHKILNPNLLEMLIGSWQHMI